MNGPRLAITIAIAVPIFAWPQAGEFILSGARGLGYAVCHQIPEHSLHMADQQLPLCARCTGIYLGFLVGLLGLGIQGRLRAAVLPTWPLVGLLLSSLLIMVLDGFNSSLEFLGGAPQIYQPTNLVRLATGMAAGTSLALLLMPLLNDALWTNPDPLPSVEDLGDLAGYAILASLSTALVNSEHPALLYPIALASALGILATLSAAGATLAAAIIRHKVDGSSWADSSRQLLAGFALATLSIALVGGARAYFSLSSGL